MQIANNVFYGGWLDGLTLYGEGYRKCHTHRQRIHISPRDLGRSRAGTDCSGMRIYFTDPDPDIIVSGNYAEGPVEGLVFYSSSGQQTASGIEIVGNTSVGGIWAGEIDGVPQVMNGNSWAAPPTWS